MDDLQSQLNSVLNNPEMMEKVMALAKNLNQPQGPSKPEENNSPLGDFDPTMFKKLASMTQNTSVDKNQQSLLRALSPYLSRQRIQKLEKAMRAAKMASMAGLLTGR